MQFTVSNTTGKSTTLEASDAVFATKVNKPLIAQAVRVFLSNARQGTSKTKTRAEVARTKKKWFKQKGTGNARHGARSANIFVGGGVSHGPTGHENWSLNLSKQMKKKALMSALSAQKDSIVVTTVFGDIQAKTKDAQAFLKKLAPKGKRILVVVDREMDNIARSMSNIANVVMTSAQNMNILDVTLADSIIMTKEAVKMVEDRLAGKVVEKAAGSNLSEVAEVKKTTVKVAKKAATPVKKTVKKVVAKK